MPTLNNLEKEGLKTSWENEKLLVTSIFSFSHNVFYPIKDDCLNLRFPDPKFRVFNRVLVGHFRCAMGGKLLSLFQIPL